MNYYRLESCKLNLEAVSVHLFGDLSIYCRGFPPQVFIFLSCFSIAIKLNRIESNRAGLDRTGPDWIGLETRAYDIDVFDRPSRIRV